MKNKKRKKIIAIYSTIAIIISMMSLITFPASAATQVYESESNNTYATADVTQGECQNRGAISSVGDIDWWEVTFTETGIANIWLGNIPSGCDYDIYLYESDGSLLIAKSIRRSSTQELIVAKVYADIPVLVKIVSVSGYSSSQYLLATKAYDPGLAKAFVFNDSRIDSRGTGTPFVSTFNSGGYTASSCVNYTADSIYGFLPTHRVAVIHNHGNAGFIAAYEGETRIIASGSNTTINKSLSSFAAGGLSSMNLLLFRGCYTGNLSQNGYGNLVDMALQKGVGCAIGWTGETHTYQAVDWMEEFLYHIACYETVESARLAANSYITDLYGATCTMALQYVGTSKESSYVLG